VAGCQQGLFLDQAPPEQAARLARSLAPAAATVARELRQAPRDERDIEELERRLVGTYGDAAEPDG
jgi:hypothetical protein